MRIALGIEYQGTDFHGWQRQSIKISVQVVVEKAVSSVANEEIKLICAGRTDAGVHALAQVVHFDTDAIREDRAWILGANNLLPASISIIWAKQVDDDFHARFSAQSRQYRYIILNTLARPAILSKRVWWMYHKLDEVRMQQAAKVLVGKHDFNAFRATQCQSKSSVRTMEYVDIHRRDDFIYCDIKGDAFLHHMVRNIIGSLMRVGQSLEEIGWISEVLASLNRNEAGITAPSSGLYLVGAYYAEKYQIPPPPKAISFDN